MIGITRTPLGVCARTVEVRDALVASISGVVNCADVTTDHLAAITGPLNLEIEGITALAAGDFAGLTGVTELHLNHNDLSTLPAGVFDGLTGVTKLYLWGIQLSTPPAGVFDGLTGVTELYLFGNALTTLPAGVFDGLTALETLQLSGNALASLPDDVFDGLTALDHLDLGGNGLTTLPAGVFDGLTALETLRLDDNELTTLPDDVFEPLTALTDLRLGGNPGAPFAPVADALPDDGTVSTAGGTVTLIGSGSDGGPWGDNVTYGWTTTTSGVTFDDNTSATPVATIPMLADDTVLTFTLTVTGAGHISLGTAAATDTATVTATAPPSDDATLSGLALTEGGGNVIPLDPPFMPGTIDYEASVENGVDTVTLTPTVNDSDATVAYLDASDMAITDTDANTLALDAPLTEGTNTFKVVVTAEDDNTTQTYTVVVTRALPALSFVSVNVEVAENEGVGMVGVELDRTSLDTITVDYQTQDSTAVAGVDYTATMGTLTFAPGSDYQAITIPILDNDTFEAGAPGSFRVMLGNPAGATLPASAVATVSIRDDEGVPTALIADVTAGEGGTMRLTLTLDHPSSLDTAYGATAGDIGGTATRGVDYEDDFLTGGSVPFTVPAGDLSATLAIAITDDMVAEDNETITIRWTLDQSSNRGEATPVSLDFTGAITDDDAAGVTVSETALTVTEEDTTGDSYTVVLDSRPTADVMVTVAAPAGTDVTPKPATLTFTSLDWDTPRTVTVTADNDGDTDNDTVTLTHSAASSDGNYSTVTIPGVMVTVLDNDTAASGAPEITGAPMDDDGNPEPQHGLTLTVDTSGISDADGLTAPGYMYQWIRVDGSNEDDIPGATVATYTAVLADVGMKLKVKVIFTDDGGAAETLTSMATASVVAQSVVSFRSSTASVTEGDVQGVLLTLDLSPHARGSGTVQLLSEGQNGATPADYRTNTSVDFTPGDLGRTIEFVAHDDVDDDDGESVKISLGMLPPWMKEGADAEATVTLIDTDNTPATGAPVISGAAQVGEVLTAETGGIADADGLTSPGYTWQWLRVDSDGVSNETMIGANAGAYTLVAADAGGKIRVRVSFTDDAGNPEALTSDAWLANGTITPLSTDATLSGLTLADASDDSAITLNEAFASDTTDYTANVANDVDTVTLTATTTDDGATVSVVTLGGTAIADSDFADGITIPSLLVGDNEINVVVTAEDDTDTQDYTVMVTRTPAFAGDVITGASDSPQEGDTLTVHPEVIEAEYGLMVNATFSYQWFRVEDGSSVGSNARSRNATRNVPGNVTCNVPGTIMRTVIPDATSATYMLVAEDLGRTIGVEVNWPGNMLTCIVTGTGTVAAAVSDRTAPVASWLPRFGRTVSEQVVEAAQARMAATPVAGLAGQLAGQTIAIAPGRGSAEARAAAKADFAALGESFFGAGNATGNAWDDIGDGRDGAAERGYSSRALTGRDFLTGSAFALTGHSGDSAATLWGRGAVTSFDGRDGSLSLDGEVVSGMLGIDWRNGERSGGLMLSRSRGEGDYRSSAAGGATSDDGRISATLTGLYPWLGHRVNDRLTLWGVAGYGRGTLTLTPAGEDALSAGIGLTMGSVGARGALGAGAEGVVLAWEADALALRTTSDAASGVAGRLDATSSGVTRLLLGLTGSRRFRLGSGAALTPGLEVGLRHDGGDAETGFGADIGVSLDFADPARGITAALSARGLLDHAASDFRERGLSVTLTWDQRPGSDLGWSLSLDHGVGAATEGGAASLLARQSLAGLLTGDGDDGADTTEGNLQRRFDATLGYGFPMAAGRFVAVSGIGFGLTDAGREYSVGWRLGLARSGPMDLHLRLEATRQESATGSPTHDLGLDLGAATRW